MNKGFIGKTFITKSFEETQSLGAKIAEKLQGGKFIALYGDLGSGKTTFTQGFAKGLGIKKRIISPTFVIVRSYGIRNLYHIDLYRVSSDKDIEGLGLWEIINNPSNIIVVEWAEKLGKLLPEKRLDIKFEYLKDTKRRIIVKNLEING